MAKALHGMLKLSSSAVVSFMYGTAKIPRLDTDPHFVSYKLLQSDKQYFFFTFLSLFVGPLKKSRVGSEFDQEKNRIRPPEFGTDERSDPTGVRNRREFGIRYKESF